LSALRDLGVKAYSETANGCPPVIVESNGLLPGYGGTYIRGNGRSPFVSALLMIGPFHSIEPLQILLEGPLVSAPYVRMTEAMLGVWGARWGRRRNAHEL